MRYGEGHALHTERNSVRFSLLNAYYDVKAERHFLKWTEISGD